MSWRYRSGRLYDFVSFERLVYGPARHIGISSLGLAPGETVIDIGCGTGLSLEHLSRSVGPAGRVIGIDASSGMAERARQRAADLGLSNVEVHIADASTLTRSELGVTEGADAIIFCYALSVIPAWREAWLASIHLLKDDARVCIVDMARPDGWGAFFTPIAQLACFFGDAEIDRHPWTVLTESGLNARQQRSRSGHIRVTTAALSATQGKRSS